NSPPCALMTIGSDTPSGGSRNRTKAMPAERLTPWIDWPQKPVRVGWYETRMAWFGTTLERRLWWNGVDFWDSDDCGPGFQYMFSPGDQWRDLAEKPKEQGNDN